jgi:glucose/arabinose dehydrogenase
MTQRGLLLFSVVILLLAAAGYWQRGVIVPSLFAPRQATVTPGIRSFIVPVPTATLEPAVAEQEKQPQPAVAVVATGLAIPWEIAFLPDGSLLVTERPGRLLKITNNRTVIPVQGVRHIGEGGLLGLAVHPDFSRNHWLYIYLTTSQGSGLRNRVERYRLDGEHLAEREVILDNIPGAQYHDGGRLAFGPDNLLYITTGDAGSEANAQNKESLAGKILRLTDEGDIPPGNPFGSAVYSYGHRNSQGLAWDAAGRLWATEHGRSGVRSGFDELNLIEPGKNYGWPDIQGDERAAGMVSPVIHSGASDIWAPAGAAILGDSIFFAGLRGASLYEVQLNGFSAENLTAHFASQFGRLRAVVVGPDGQLYITTSNTDGRGQPQAGDDKIIRINPDLFR